MGGFGAWPVVLPKNTTGEAFDRTRLLIDLDEATDTESSPALLLIVGVPRDRDGADSDPAVKLFMARLEETMAILVGAAGSVYRTRSTEVCALVEGSVSELRDILGGLHTELAREQRPFCEAVVGIVSLPEEAGDALDALALADERMARSTGFDAETFDPEGAARRAALFGGTTPPRSRALRH
jgi:hypothetical protein